MTISIIIPVYNTSAYLHQCMDSVCGQSYQNLEIIVVNDGSTDDSLSIIRAYEAKDPRIIVIDQDNMGLSAARNAGLAKASGEYVMFLDSDDWVGRDVCEKALQTIEEDNSQVVIWNYYREYADGAKKTQLLGTEHEQMSGEAAEKVFRRMIGPVGIELKTPNLLDSFSTAWGKLYRRDIIGSVRFVDTKKIGSEDLLFNTTVFSNVHSISYLPDFMSHYRKTAEGSLTTSYSKEIVTRWQELTKRIRAQLDRQQATAEYYQALTHRICCSLVGLGFRLFFDKRLSFKEQICELKRLLSMEYFHLPITKMDYSQLPLHWKVFFRAAEKNRPLVLAVLYHIMGILKKMV